VIVLGGLVHLAGLAPAPGRFDVFAADPVDAAPEHAVVQSVPEPPRPRPIVGPPKGRLPQPARSPVVVSAKSALPQDPPVAPTYTEVPLSSPATSEVEVEGPLPQRWAPESFAALEPTTAPLVASMALPRADVLRPVPGMPLTVAAVAPPTVSLLEAVAPKQQPAESPRKMVAAPAQSEPASAPATAAPAPEPAPPPSPPSPVAAERVAPSTPAAPAGVEPSRPPAIASAAPTPPARSDPPAAAHVSSPLGLGLGRLRIRLDGDSMRTTDRETDVISGTLVGGQPERVVVQVGERTSVPTLAGRAFATAVKLSPGVNRVRVLATDAQGAEVEEVVTVQYKPPVAPDVAITSPRDGYTLAPDDPPLVAVEGQVSDPGQSTVWIVANDRRVMVPVTAGRFRHVLPVLEPMVRVRAETGSEGRGSATVTVHAGAAMPAIGLSLVDWPRHTAGPAHMTVTWRPNPAKLDGGAPPLLLRGLAADTGDAGADVFYLRNARPGVYTFSMTYRAGATPAVRPVLYLAGAPRSLAPVTLDGSGRVVLARLLLPQGVLWEQEDWFTGRSASGDTVTKFRFPEGVSWTERLGDLGR